MTFIFNPPDNCVPELFPEPIGKVLKEAGENLCVPFSMAAAVAIGTMSAATQHGFAVEYNGAELPVTVSTNVIAGKSQGKSITIRQFAQPLFAFRDEQISDRKTRQMKYKKEMADWRATERGLLWRKSKLIGLGKPIDEVEQLLKAHRRPAELVDNQLVFERISEAAMLKYFDGSDRNMVCMLEEGRGLWSDRPSERYNQGLDGSTINESNFHTGAVGLRPRLTLVVGVQPLVFEKALQVHRDVLIDAGICDRMLHVRCPPLESECRPNFEPGPYVLAFRKRVATLLEALLSNDKKSAKRTLRLSAKAQTLADDYARRIATLKKPGELLCGIQGFAGRFIENMIRLAAVMHAFAELGDEISRDTIARAYNIMRFFTHHHIQIFATQGPTIDLAQAVDDLERFLRLRYLSSTTQVKWSEILTSAPRPRDKDRYRLAVVQLVQRQVLTPIWLPGKRKLSEAYLLNLTYFGQPALLSSRDPVTTGNFLRWDPPTLRQF